MIYLGMIMLLAWVALHDRKHKVIEDGVTLLGILIALNVHLYFGGIYTCIAGLTAGILVIWFGNLFRIHNLGGGDAKLMAFIGSVFGPWPMALTWGLSLLFFHLYFLRHKREKLEPYAPFILAGFLGACACLSVTYFLTT
jgi:Flp pilus assembly protein protease CpaA